MQSHNDTVVNELFVLRACVGIVSELKADLKERKRYLNAVESSLSDIINQRKEVEKANQDVVDCYNDLTARREIHIEHCVAENFHSSINPIVYILFVMSPITFIVGLIYVLKKNRKDKKAKEALRAQKTREVDAAIEKCKQNIEKGCETIKAADEAIESTKIDIEIIKSEIQYLTGVLQTYETALSEMYGHVLIAANYEYIDLAIYGLQTGRFANLENVVRYAAREQFRFDCDNAAAFVANEIKRRSSCYDKAYGALFAKCASALNEKTSKWSKSDISSYHDDILPLLELVTQCSEEKLMDNLYRKRDVPIEQLLDAV